MEALIVNKASKQNKFKFNSLVTLFKNKIEDYIVHDKLITISASNLFMECRNTMFIQDYEYDSERFYINNENFELHLKVDEIKEVKYDNIYDECFTFVHNNGTEINLYFI